MILPPIQHKTNREDLVMADLLAKGSRELSLSEVLKVIKAYNLPPMRTLNRLCKWFRLEFVGKHRNDQRYVAKW